MTQVKLTKKAQDIVNQIMSADAVDIIISNESLNAAVISDGIIKIDSDHIKSNIHGDMTITLYKLSKIAAV